MAYIARHYVRVNGKMFTPGEIITETIARDKAGRLSALNAIALVPESDSTDAVMYDSPTTGDTHDPAEPERGDTETGDEDEEPVEYEDAGDDEEEAAPPEIDVADSIVPVQEPEENPAPASGRRGKKK